MKIRQRIFIIFLLIPLSGFTFHQGNSTAGDSMATAINLPLDTQTTGVIAPSSYFWYNVTITTTGDYSFNLTADPSTQFSLSVYDTNYSGVGFAYQNTYPKVIAVSMNPGVYSIQIYASQGSGSFTITATHAIQGQNLNNPILLPLNTIFSGVGLYDSYFILTIPTSGYYKFNLTAGGNTYFTYYLLDSNGFSIASPSSSTYPENLVINITAGNYFINLQFYDGSGPFNISVCNYTIHPGEDLPNAISLQMNTIVTGVVPITMYFNFSITNAGYYDFILNGDINAFVYMDIYTEYNVYIGGSPNTNYPVSLPYNLSMGNYYIKMYFASLTGTFNISYAPYTIHQGEDLAHAIIIPESTNVTGSTPYNIYYNFTINYAGYYKFSIVPLSNAGFQFTLYLALGNYVDGSYGFPYTIENLQPGGYYLVINANYGSGLFNLSYIPYNPLPGEVLSTANALTINSPVNGSLPTDRFYNFSITQTDTYLFQIVGQIYYGSFGLNLYYSDGYFIPIYITNGIYSSWLNITLSPGSYYLNMYGPFGAFTLSFGFASNSTINTTPPTSPYTTPTTNSNTSPYSTSSPNSSTSPYSSTGISNTSTNSSNTSNNTQTHKNTITFSTPFSSFDIIFASLTIMALLGIFTRRRRNI